MPAVTQIAVLRQKSSRAHQGILVMILLSFWPMARRY